MFKKQAAIFYRLLKISVFGPDKTRAESFFNAFENIPQRACLKTMVQIVRGEY